MGATDIVGGRAQAHLLVGRETSPGTRFGIEFWDSNFSAPIKQRILGDVLTTESCKLLLCGFGTVADSLSRPCHCTRSPLFSANFVVFVGLSRVRNWLLPTL